jgi:hypothetical protein
LRDLAIECLARMEGGGKDCGITQGIPWAAR